MIQGNLKIFWLKKIKYDSEGGTMIKNIFIILSFLNVFPYYSLAAKPTLLLYVIDGLQSDAAAAAMNNGAKNLKYLYDNGVRVEESYCVSPSPYLRLPDGSLPWGTSSPPNVAMHTGTHVFESRKMDDIFLAARRSGIKSIFAGGAENYKEFNTPDFSYVSNTDPDSIMVQHGIDQFKNDDVRLIRLHMQRIRNHWTGPEDKLKTGSDYQNYLIYLDHLLGKLIETFKSDGVWDSYLYYCRW